MQHSELMNEDGKKYNCINPNQVTGDGHEHWNRGGKGLAPEQRFENSEVSQLKSVLTYTTCPPEYFCRKMLAQQKTPHFL